MFSLFFIFLKSAIILKNSRIEYYDLLSWHYVGTSLDGVDIALTDIQSNQTKLIAADFTPMPANLREKSDRTYSIGRNVVTSIG